MKSIQNFNLASIMLKINLIFNFFLEVKIVLLGFILHSSLIYGQTFTIGTGTSTTGLVPITSSAAYSYNQTIYPASLLTAQGMSPGMAITSIAWYVNTANTSTTNATWVVYLGNTAQNSYASATNWIPSTSLTQVFSGSVVPSPAGWKTITLTTPFVWNGSNLVIGVDENAASFSSTTTMFRTTTTTTNNSIYRGNTLNILPTTPGTATGLLMYYPNIQLGIGCWGTQNNASISLNSSAGCPGSPITITSTGASTSTGISYQWQSSPNGVSWSNVGTNTPTYSANPLTTQYFQMITSCLYNGSSSASNQVLFTVNPSPNATITANGPTTFCQGNSVTLSIPQEIGVTYQWKNNGVNISGATSSSYQVTSSGNYTVEATNATPCSTTSNQISVTVSPISVAGLASTNQTICTGSSPANITLTGNTGTIQWQVSTDNVNFNTITGATTTTLTTAQLGTLTTTRYYRAVVTSGTCASVNSNVVTVTVSPISVAGTAGSNQTICSGSSLANITLSGNVGTIQWQVSSNNVTYSPIPGATTNPLTSAQMGILNVTQYYRAVVTSGTCTSANSNVVTVTVNPSSVAGTMSVNQIICSGSLPSNITITGSTGTIQWQVSSDNVQFNNITGANTATLTSAQMGTLSTTRYYRAIVTSGVCPSVTSNVVIVTVNPVPTMSSPSSGVTCSGVAVNFPLSSNTPGSTFSWLASNNLQIVGESLSAVSSPTITDVLINNTAGALNVSYTISPSFTSGGVTCTGPSQSVIITTNILPSSSVTVSGPTTFCSGNSVTLTTNAGTGYSYQWKNNGVSIPGATSQAFTAINSGSYTVLVTNSNGCSVTSSATIVTVNSTTAGSASSNQTICNGTLPANITLIGNTGTIQWQVSTDNITFVNILAATSSTLTTAQMGVLNSTRYYRAVVSNGVCSPVSSNVVIVTVTSTSASGTANSNQSICSGTSPSEITLSGNIGTIQWQVSSDNVNFSPILGATSSPLTSAQMGILTATRYYRAVVTSGNCASVISNVITVFVNPVPSATIVANGSTIICQGSSVNLSANLGAGLSYQWQLNNVPIDGQTNSTLNVISSGYYTITITNGFNCSSLSNSIEVNVNTNPAIPIITANSTTEFCLGGSVMLSAPITPSLSYQWQNNGVNITNATSNQYIVYLAGNYSLLATNTSNCTTSSAITPVVVYSLPIAGISAQGATIFCEGDSVILQGSTLSNGTYNWFNQNVSMPNSNMSSIVVFETGSYSYQIVDSNNCFNQSDSINIFVNFPDSAVIYTTSLGPFLLNGTTYTESGVYIQNLETINGCDSTLTLYLDIENLSLADLNNECGILFYPNPTVDNVVYFSNNESCDIEITAIVDLFGREIPYSQEGSKVHVISEVKGVYYFILNDNKTLRWFKLILD